MLWPPTIAHLMPRAASAALEDRTPRRARRADALIAPGRRPANGQACTHLSPAFTLRGLTKRYGEGPSAVLALSEVDFDIDEGELLVLLGPSGSGKSTLLNILGGLDRPTAGDAAFRGISLGAMSDNELTLYRRRHVGFIFQFYNLIPSLTALENVELVGEIADRPLSAEEALDLVGLGGRADHFPAQLSGGEQQRVAVARAIAKRPAIMLCDEPTGALDVKTGVRVLEALVEVNKRYGSTTLIVTHNGDVARMGGRVVRFGAGKIRSVEVNKTPAAPAELVW